MGEIIVGMVGGLLVGLLYILFLTRSTEVIVSSEKEYINLYSKEGNKDIPFKAVRVTIEKQKTATKKNPDRKEIVTLIAKKSHSYRREFKLKFED